MSGPRVTLAPTRQYRLVTFGMPGLLGPADEKILGTHGHHRRRLALLAVLAVAGERGKSRDQLLLLFWPEATQARARHSLDQLLYALRGSLSESVFASVNPVCLNPESVASDVDTFNAALERDDLDAAVAVYRGPFLDGFYLDDAPEFERWVESERPRFAGRYGTALERLARNAEAMGHSAVAVQWWQKLSDFDPVSSKYAAGLVRAFMSSGDRAAALRFAERYESIVMQELGTRAGPAGHLIAEVRAAAESEPVAVARPPSLATAATAGTSPPAMASATELPNELQPLPRRRRWWRGTYLVATLAVVALVVAAVFLRTTTRARAAPESGERSIAVLPLANVSRDPKDAAIADGLSEELIGVLAKLRGVRVTARTSATAFKNSEIDVRRIGDSLGVDYVLEGGIQKSGPRLRVQVRLVEARTGATLWSETYDRELRDIFAVQSDIAEAVARELDATFGTASLIRARRGPTTNVAAHELYLRGSDPALTRSDSAVRVGIEYFRQAIALDSHYAAAHAGLARLQLRLANGDDTAMTRRERLVIAEQAALKAISLDSASAEAHASLAIVRRNRLDFAGSEAELRRAIELDPTNARFHEWLVQGYARTGRPVEALAEARRAVALDPLSPTAIAELARALLENDRCDEALAHLAKLRSLRPPLLRAGEFAARCYVRKGMWTEAVAEAQQSAAAGPSRQALLGFLYARAGQPDDARRILAPLLDRAQRTGDRAFDVATIYAGLGDKARAFSWLGRVAQDGWWMNQDRLDLVLDALAPDSRVDAFRQRTQKR